MIAARLLFASPSTMPEDADAVAPWRRPPKRIPQPPRTPPPPSLLAKRPEPKPPVPKPDWPKRPLPWPKMKVKVEPKVEPKPLPKRKPKTMSGSPSIMHADAPQDGHNVHHIKALLLAVYRDRNPAQLASPGFLDNLLTEYKGQEREVYFAVCEKYKVTPMLRLEPGDWHYKAPMQPVSSVHPPPPTRPVPPHPDDLLTRYRRLVRPKTTDDATVSDVDVSEKDNEQSGATKRQKMDCATSSGGGNDDNSDNLDDGCIPGPPPSERPVKACATRNCTNRSAWECSTGCCAAHCNDVGCPRHSANYREWLRSQARWERANRRRGGVKTTSLKNLRSVD